MPRPIGRWRPRGAGAPTIGVLGGGHAHFYPARERRPGQRNHRGRRRGRLAPSRTRPPALPPQFLQRNAVIAALADAVVVVEAAARSGSLNTAAWAADGGKPVMAFPGDVERPKVAGCLALIHDGALLVRDARDVLAALPLRAPIVTPRTRTYDGTTALERTLLAALHDGERDIDTLVELSGTGAGLVLAALCDLELAGAVERANGRSYAFATS